jgi:dihydroorotate dehydrogenase
VLYRLLYQLVLRWLPPVAIHELAAKGLAFVLRAPGARRLVRAWAYPGLRGLSVTVLGQRFPSPLGAAAGMDKEASWFDALGAIGFGAVEVGTVTPLPQAPNPGPTIARITAEGGLLNRMGFPNPGAATIAATLMHRSGETLVGVNIGKQRTTEISRAVEDYRSLAHTLAPLADYLVVNISSPNTAGLRELGEVGALEPLLSAVQAEIADTAPGTPLLLKVSPDADDAQLDAIADLALALELDGLIATNTTVDRGVLRQAPPWSVRRLDGGGISGRPLKARSLAVLRRLYERTEGRLTLISVGGVESVDDVWERLAHGASLVQAYTGFVYGGPAWPAGINHALVRRLRAVGYSSIQELIGAATSGGN